MPVDTFVENTWYVAGRSQEFPVDEPKGRVIAGRPALVWRARDGKVGVFVQRHAPWLVAGALRAFGVRSRPEPTRR